MLLCCWACVGEVLHFSSQRPPSLSVFISFCLLCCILGKEVKIAFALQVLYVGVLQTALQADTTLLIKGGRGGFDIVM